MARAPKVVKARYPKDFQYIVRYYFGDEITFYTYNSRNPKGNHAGYMTVSFREKGIILPTFTTNKHSSQLSPHDAFVLFLKKRHYFWLLNSEFPDAHLWMISNPLNDMAKGK